MIAFAFRQKHGCTIRTRHAKTRVIVLVSVTGVLPAMVRIWATATVTRFAFVLVFVTATAMQHFFVTYILTFVAVVSLT